MKKRKLIILSIIIALGIANSTMNAYADTNDFEYDLEEQVEVTYEEVEDAIAYVKEQDEGAISEGFDDTNFDISEYDLTGAYVEYAIVGLPVSEYMDGKSFVELLADSYSIKVPYTSPDNTKMFLELDFDDAGKLKMRAKGTVSDSQINCITLDVVESIISKNVEEEIENVMFCYSGLYHSTWVYIKTVANEYLIPFAAENTLNMENGKVYSVEKFFEKMNRTFDESQLIGSEYSGGVPYRQPSLWQYVMGVGMLCVVVAVSTGCIIKLKKK